MSSLSRPSPRPRWLLIHSLVVMIAVTCVSGTASGQRRGGKPTAAKPPKINLPASVRGKAEVDMQVAPVNANTRSSIVAQARRLDSIVEAKLIAAGQHPMNSAAMRYFCGEPIWMSPAEFPPWPRRRRSSILPIRTAAKT